MNDIEFRSLIETINVLLAERDRRYEERFQAIKENVALALTVAKEKSLEHNDILNKMKEKDKTYAVQREVDIILDNLKDRVGTIEGMRVGAVSLEDRILKIMPLVISLIAIVFATWRN